MLNVLCCHSKCALSSSKAKFLNYKQRFYSQKSFIEKLYLLLHLFGALRQNSGAAIFLNSLYVSGHSSEGLFFTANHLLLGWNKYSKSHLLALYSRRK